MKMGVGKVLKYVTWPVWGPVSLILKATGAAIWFPAGVATAVGVSALTQCDITNDAPKAIETAVERYGSQDCHTIFGEEYCDSRRDIIKNLDKEMRQIETTDLYLFEIEGGREFDDSLKGMMYRSTIGGVKNGFRNAKGSIEYVIDFFGNEERKNEIADTVKKDYHEVKEKMKAIREISENYKKLKK